MTDLNLDAIENRLDFGHHDAWALLTEVRRLRELVSFREAEIATLTAEARQAKHQKVFVLLYEGAPEPEGFGPIHVEGIFGSQERMYQSATRRLEEIRTTGRYLGDSIIAVDTLTWDSDGVAKIDRRHLGSRPTFKAEEHFVDWLSEPSEL